MNEENNIQTVKHLVSVNQVKNAISFLVENFAQSENGNQILLVSSRFYELESAKLNNLIKFEEYILESNKIRFSILELCDNVLPKKNEPLGSEISKLIKLLQYRAQKINKIFDSIKFKEVDENDSRQKLLLAIEGGVDRHKDAILYSKNRFNELHKKHIEALKTKNFILANDIGLDIHALLFGLKDLDISEWGYAYHSRPTLGRHLYHISLKHKNKEKFYETWGYLDSSTASNIEKWQTLAKEIEKIKQQIKIIE